MGCTGSLSGATPAFLDAYVEIWVDVLCCMTMKTLLTEEKVMHMDFTLS